MGEKVRRVKVKRKWRQKKVVEGKNDKEESLTPPSMKSDFSSSVPPPSILMDGQFRRDDLCLIHSISRRSELNKLNGVSVKLRQYNSGTQKWEVMITSSIRAGEIKKIS